MKKECLLAALAGATLLLSSIGVTGSNLALASEPLPAREAADAAPALWQVSDEDTTLYLFGTVHALRSGIPWFGGKVKEAFDASDALQVEMIEPESALLQEKVGAIAVATDGIGLSQRMTGAKRQAYLDALKSLKLPFEAIEQFEPWMAFTILTVLPLNAAGYDAKNGVEEILQAAAAKTGKPVFELETVDEQLGIFDAMEMDTQLALLNDTVAELPVAVAQLDGLVAAWRQGKPDELDLQVKKSRSMTPEIIKILLTDRNARWTDMLEARMGQPGVVFVAVGAGHLAGPDSVVAMLEKRGLAVNRVQ